MFKVFSFENINEVTDKKPLICFYTENGGCGTSGLLITIFEDRLSFGYSTYYDSSDKSLLKEIAQIIPEMRWLIRYDDGDYKPYRPTFFNEMEDVYLGLGNYAYINDEIFSKYIGSDGLSCNIVMFRNIVEKISDVSLGEMFLQVREVLKEA